ncbi:Bud site selection protein, Revert to axial protein 1 [Fusarium falciforme]
MDQSSPLQPDLQRNRLPTLFEVLSRRVLPPVDLFSFYVFMRDQQRSVDYLDFWLDVSQHTSLCRAYVRELRSAILSSTAEPRPPQHSTETGGDPQVSSGQSEQQQPEESGTVDTSDQERSSQVLRLSQDDQPTEVPTPPPVDMGPSKDQIRGYFMSPSLRGGGSTDWLPTGSVSTVLSRTRHFFATFKSRRDPKAGEDRAKRLTQLNLRGGASNSSLPTYGTMRLTNSEDVEESAANSLEREGDLDRRVSAFLRGERVSGRATPSDANDTQLGPAAGSSSRPSTDQGPATAGTISRQDIRASAEKIIYTYILPGAEREIILPGPMTGDLVAAVEVSDRDDPEVFDVVKDYVFKAMERDAFPGFLPNPTFHDWGIQPRSLSIRP